MTYYIILFVIISNSILISPLIVFIYYLVFDSLPI